MDIREGIKSQFTDLGFEDLSDDVLDKCVEVCSLHHVDEVTFVETWAAYSVTYLRGEGPSLETLAKMERKEFMNQNKNISVNSVAPLTVYNKTTTSTKIYSSGLLTEHNTTPKARTGENCLAKQFYTPSSKSTFSPASFSPSLTSQPCDYASRTNAREVVFEFVERTPSDWKAEGSLAVNMALYSEEVLHTRCKLMMEPLSDKATVLNNIIEHLGSHLVEGNGLQEPLHNRYASQTEIVCVGRIVCDSNEHLNASSVLLEGSRMLCLGMTVPLDLSRLPSYALFPGQVVAVQGINPTGEKFVVNKLFASAVLPPPLTLPSFSGTIEIVVAAGPFTPSNSLLYEPLEDLMRYVRDFQPHVLILLGPLVDLRQTQVHKCCLAESYDVLYDKIIKGVMDQLKGGWTKVVMVPSIHDAACLPVFPTPPPSMFQRPSPTLHLLSDPSLLSVNGLVVALTTTDTLMHLGKEEISFPYGAGDRLRRLASHLIQQQSMYPLYPPAEGLSVDCDLWDIHASLPVTPHILIAPSNFRYFIKEINNCLVVNPEHLSKGSGGGTFVRLEIDPALNTCWSLSTHVSAQILHI